MVPIYFEADITLQDLADAVALIGCRLEVNQRAEICVTHILPDETSELPLVDVEDLTYIDLPNFLKKQAD